MNLVRPEAWIELERVASRRKAREHVLVLEARGIPLAQAQTPEGLALLVPAPLADAARAELERYERENAGWPPREAPVSVQRADALGAIVYATICVALFLAQRRFAFGVDWTAAGRSAAERVRAGEWWRTLTALSLHGDVAHLAGNLVFGGFFCILLAQVLGPGVGWALVLLSGALGNLVNAWVQEPAHASIGASTAIFGAVGALGVRRLLERRPLRRKRRLGPLVFAIVVLGYIGFPAVVPEELRQPGRPQVDVLAHLFGFVAGALLGLFVPRESASSPLVQRASALGAAALLVLAWALALR